MIHRHIEKLTWKKRFSYLKNVLFDEKILHQKGTKVQIIKFSPGTRIGPHFHKNVYEIFFITNGHGSIIFNGKKHKAKPGDIFLCQPGDVHEIINNAKEELVIVIFKTNEKTSDIVWC